MIQHEQFTPNHTRVFVGPLCLWFSYSTIVAVRMPNGITYISAYDWRDGTGWKPTTKKHIANVKRYATRSVYLGKRGFKNLVSFIGLSIVFSPTKVRV